MVVLTAWTVGLPLIGNHVVPSAQADESPTSTLRILWANQSAVRPAGTRVRIASSDNSAPQRPIAAQGGRPVYRAFRTQPARALPQAARIPSMPGSGIAYGAWSNPVRTAASSARGGAYFNVLRTAAADRGESPNVFPVAGAETGIDTPHGRVSAGSEDPVRLASYDHPLPGLAPAFSPPATIPGANTRMRRIRAALPAVDPLADMDRQGPLEMIDRIGELTVLLRPTKLLRTKADVCRTEVADPSICDVVQIAPREVSIVGKRQGATRVTLWFRDGRQRPVSCPVQVAPDPGAERCYEIQHEVLQDVLAELFPESKVRFAPLADKLIVRQPAQDTAEAP